MSMFQRMQAVVFALAGVLVLALFPASSASAGWTYLRLNDPAPNVSQAFNWARACKTTIVSPRYGPLFKVRFMVERKYAAGNSYIRAHVVDGYGNPTGTISQVTNNQWYGLWAGLDTHMGIFTNHRVIFYVYDQRLGLGGPIQVGRHGRHPDGYLTVRWAGNELATC